MSIEEKKKAKCVAFAGGGKDNDTDNEASSGAAINASTNGAWAKLEAIGAVAFKGQVAVQAINVGGKLAKENVGEIGVSFDLQFEGAPKKKKLLSREYHIKCELT